MQRVLVMGCSGAGKTTFGRTLADKLAVPFVSLDQLFWQPGWCVPTMEDFTAKATREAEKPTWVIMVITRATAPASFAVPARIRSSGSICHSGHAC